MGPPIARVRWTSLPDEIWFTEEAYERVRGAYGLPPIDELEVEESAAEED